MTDADLRAQLEAAAAQHEADVADVRVLRARAEQAERELAKALDANHSADLEFFEYEEEPMSEPDSWCVMCGAAPGEPCVTISGGDAGEPRPLPHFYRGSAEKPAVAIRDEPSGWASAAAPDPRPRPWPHSHADDPGLSDGTPFGPDDSWDVVLPNLFVRCHDCHGARSDGDCSCGGTGFDWSDTVDARATIAALPGARLTDTEAAQVAEAMEEERAYLHALYPPHPVTTERIERLTAAIALVKPDREEAR